MGFYGKQIDGKEVVIKTRAKDVLWDEQKPDYYLHRCPKCGAEQRRVGGVGLMFVGAIDSGGWRVICNDCLYMVGDLCATWFEAVDKWNEGDDT